MVFLPNLYKYGILQKNKIMSYEKDQPQEVKGKEPAQENKSTTATEAEADRGCQTESQIKIVIVNNDIGFY
ncbi:MAG: hypothetical protein JWM20_1 [Patescibacteria group bacterium]|nr:hypothetical protein [Patescibacteria group bacterium]